MVDLSVQHGELVVQVRGWSKLWAFKRRLHVPLSDIKTASFDPNATNGWWRGWRWPGTNIPGVITAGTFYRRGKREFWDVRRRGSAVTIDLVHGKYTRLVVDVADPQAAVARINEALGRAA